MIPREPIKFIYEQNFVRVSTLLRSAIIRFLPIRCFFIVKNNYGKDVFISMNIKCVDK